MRIHPVISVAQLEPCLQVDPYGRPRPDNPGPVETEDPSYPAFEIERLVDRKIVRGAPQYLVKWKGWDHSWNAYYPLRELALKAQDMVDDYDANNPFEETVKRRRQRRLIPQPQELDVRNAAPVQAPPPARRGRPRKHPLPIA